MSDLSQLTLGDLNECGEALHRLARAERMLAIPLVTTRVLAEATTPAEGVSGVLRAVGQGMGWDFASWWQVDPASNSLRLEERWRRREATDAEEFPEQAEGFARRVLSGGVPAWTTEVGRDEATSVTPDTRGSGCRSAFGFPVHFQGEVKGVFGFFGHEPEPVDDELLAVARGLGTGIGLFLERKRIEGQVLKLSRAVEQSASLVLISDAEGRIEYVNPVFSRVTGYSAEEVIGQNPRVLKSGTMPQEVYQNLWETITAGREWRGEFENRKKDGTTYWATASISPVRSPAGELTHFVAIQEDVTGLKQAGEALRAANEELEKRVFQRTEELEKANEALRAEGAERLKLDRARRALSCCGQALVRASDESQFLREICRVIVEDAGYRLCWVGYAEHDEDRSVRPVGHAGYEEGYLRTVNVTWADTARGRGPSGKAIRTRDVVVVRDAARDPSFAPWRAEALRRGYASVIGIPLTTGAEVFGALTIYATEPDAFDDEEVALLKELADDLSYGVVSLRDRAERGRAEEGLRRAYDELEHRVSERTSELSTANARLVEQIGVRERAEEALRSSERMYRQLTEGTRDAIVVADCEGRITLFNSSAQQVFGFEEREALGQPLTILMPPEMRPAHEQAIRRYLDSRESRLVGRTVELQGRRKSGDVFAMEIALSAIDLPEGIVLLGAIRDLTERRRLQAMVVQAEKLAALGLLSAGVAHEINNPLAYAANNLAVLERDIRGMAALLELYEEARPLIEAAHPDLAARIDRIVGEIDLPYIQDNLHRLLASTRQGVKRVSDIVQNLRGFARLDQATVDRVDLRGAISSSLDMVRGQLNRRNIAVEQQDDVLPPVVCAPAQINQVVLNLLVNAMQAIDGTGRDHGTIVIRTLARDDEVALEVSDDGGGIPADVLPRIFDPFFTTKPVGQGTGLGLAISQGIVADHGGRIEVDSRPGEGTTFRIILPVGGKPREPDATPRPEPAGV